MQLGGNKEKTKIKKEREKGIKKKYPRVKYILQLR
jgi:hypothetical protein